MADKMWGLILSRATWVRRKNLVLFCRPGQCEFITKLPPPFLAPLFHLINNARAYISLSSCNMHHAPHLKLRFCSLLENCLCCVLVARQATCKRNKHIAA
jgi:hypothetical protein